MTDSYQRLREALREHAIESLRPEDHPDPVQKRLVLALRARSRGGAVGDGDIAGLLRHLLARERASHPAAEPTLLLARNELWPSRETLERAGLTVSVSASFLTLRVVPWRPSWLELSHSYEPGAPANAEVNRRSTEAVRGDPFLSIVGRAEYRSAAQREAVRAVLSMPAGSTLVVNLPTGAGKSLCAQVPALLEGARGRLTVIVVPTTALAMDQERAIGSMIPHETAFFAADGGDLQRRRGILSRVRSREQQVVFTSPEGLLGPLREAVTSTARDGGLAYLVVDEAHMVEQWGDGFRSGFQELGGLRAEFAQSSPRGSELRTVLLTATLTAECLATLGALFKTATTEFRVISATQLRPEPEYWVAQAPDASTQVSWVMEAVLRLPRSLILYVTRPAHAVEWLNRLREAGIRRSECVHGGTPNADRERILRQWQAHELDVIVATSAFGLGMDQADVRAVVHASVPENIDRYYQEVGRGGRDGLASVALAVYTAQDLGDAERLNRTAIISVNRGRQRWGMMFGSPKRRDLGRQEYRVPVDVVPSFEAPDIVMLNERNTQWNIRTLTLMQRAGLITLRGENAAEKAGQPPDAPTSGVDGSPYRVVRVVEADHLSEATWMARVEPERGRSATRDARSFELMREALSPKRCLSEIFAETYRIDGDASRTATATVRVSRACGGCPWCRRTHAATSQGLLPTPLPVWRLHGPIGASLDRLLTGRAAAVFYDHSDESRVVKLAWWLASQGLRHVVVSDDLLEQVLRGLPDHKAKTVAPFVTALSEYFRMTSPSLPTVFVLSQASVPERVIDSGGATDSAPVRVFLLRQNASSVSHPHRILRDVFDGLRFSLSEFEGNLAL